MHGRAPRPHAILAPAFPQPWPTDSRVDAVIRMVRAPAAQHVARRDRLARFHGRPRRTRPRPLRAGRSARCRPSLRRQRRARAHAAVPRSRCAAAVRRRGGLGCRAHRHSQRHRRAPPQLLRPRVALPRRSHRLASRPLARQERAGQLCPVDRLPRYARAGDCKLVWEPNRHHQLVVLARAWRTTGERRYADAVLAQLDSWLRANPFGAGMNWRSSPRARDPPDQLGLGARPDPRCRADRSGSAAPPARDHPPALLDQRAQLLARLLFQQPPDRRGRRRLCRDRVFPGHARRRPLARRGARDPDTRAALPELSERLHARAGDRLPDVRARVLRILRTRRPLERRGLPARILATRSSR